MARVNKEINHEKAHEKPSAKVEAVDVKGATEVIQAAADVSAEVADLGIDSAESAESGESFSEKKGNKKDHSMAKKVQPKTQQDLKAHIHKTIPTKKMKKEVTVAIRKEIRKEERKVLLAYAGIKKYSPHKLAEMIAKVRSLKDLLSSIVDATKEILTGLYLKWVKKEV
jgi:hypothetical protein